MKTEVKVTFLTSQPPAVSPRYDRSTNFLIPHEKFHADKGLKEQE